MKRYRRYRRRPQFLVWGFVGVLILLAMVFGHSGATMLFDPSGLLWLDDGIWTLLLVGLTALLLLLWIFAAFSLMALVVVICSGVAIVMLLSGFSLLWPLLLLVLAAWGVGKTLQTDNQA
ncbi:hypothetical protein [Shewanella dokdonensis]|uniref:Uncharacterized protein n=1 Tax=Shewanella dokdonensis TaxID=712036 RepID=A0ABX8DBL6_9GAMM|nr:hypothetical protein [Shewanella dokdonensis]MCL1074811.1 hypothetical protein [Shewanella dokdonensis]QVK22215.1 hypothetical protein KHX94_12340 [Shewanella dokdonensis]